MTNPDIAAILDEIADLLEFKGSNPFRIRAYRNAARTVHDLPESVAQITADPDRRLTDIKGIGKDLAEKLTALVETGSMPMLDELLAEIPQTVLAILRVPGLGPKRAAVLYNELSVTTLDELRVACESRQVRELKGFGAKTEETILQGLEIASGAAAEIEDPVGCFSADRVEQRVDVLGNIVIARALPELGSAAVVVPECGPRDLGELRRGETQLSRSSTRRRRPRGFDRS